MLFLIVFAVVGWCIAIVASVAFVMVNAHNQSLRLRLGQEIASHEETARERDAISRSLLQLMQYNVKTHNVPLTQDLPPREA